MADFIAAKELREKRGKIAKEMRQMVTEAGDKGFTPEQDEKFQRMDADQEQMRSRIEALEKVDGLEEALAENRDRLEVDNRSQSRGPTERQKDAIMRGWLLGEDATEEQRVLAKQFNVDISRKHLPGTHELMRTAPKSRRDIEEYYTVRTTSGQSKETDAGGGYTVPTTLRASVEIALLAFGGMRQAGTVLRTQSGETMNFPTLDDTANTGGIIAENTTRAALDLAFGQVASTVYTYTSYFVRVSKELLQDTVVPLERIIGETAGTRIARIQNTHFTAGATSTTNPVGLMTSLSATVTAISSSAGLVYNDLLDLKHAVDPAYRNGASFMFNDATLLLMKKLQDTTNQPIWRASLIAGEPDTIDGSPYVVNQDVASLSTTAANKFAAYGDLSSYLIRDALGFSMQRADERWIEQFQVGFIAHVRSGGVWLYPQSSAATGPVQALVRNTT